MKRTHEEAVDIMVDWWVEKSFKTPLNQNNGDDSKMGGLTFLLMNNLSMSAQETATPDNIEIFKTALKERLMMRQFSTIRVDYDPHPYLHEACELSGINTRCLPCKTFTRINEQNEVEGRYQYGGEFFKI